MGKPLSEMTDEERAELAEEARATVEAVTLGVEQESMPCIWCGMPARVCRVGMTWDVECACGWSASGSGPPRRTN